MTDSIVVFGAGGFIGQHLVRALVQHGESVVAVCRHRVGFSGIQIEQIVTDLRTPDDFIPILDRSRAVVHLASTSTPGSSAGLALLELEQNLRPTLALLQALQTRPTCPLLYLSSGGTLYDSDSVDAVSENANLRPRSYHGAGKAAAEHFISAWCSQFSGAATVLRPSNVYGPGQTERSGFGIIPTAFGKIVRQETLTVWGDGSAMRDYLYIDDFIALCLAILTTPMPTGLSVLNAASGVGISLNQLFEQIESISGRRLFRTYETARAVDMERIVIDPSLARQTHRWVPHTTLAEGLERAWAWFNTIPR